MGFETPLNEQEKALNTPTPGPNAKPSSLKQTPSSKEPLLTGVKLVCGVCIFFVLDTLLAFNMFFPFLWSSHRHFLCSLCRMLLIILSFSLHFSSSLAPCLLPHSFFFLS